MTEINPAFNEVWYINNSTTQPTIPHNLKAFSANIISNTYDSRSKCWIILFDKDITVIGDQAFSSCTDLIQVFLPDSVTVIGKQAFENCVGMVDIQRAKNVVLYEFAAFKSCNSICSINIPEGVETIREFAFYGCKNLRKVTMPNSLRLIGLRAFSYHQRLTEVFCKAILPPQTLILGNQWNAFDYYDNDNVYPPTGFNDIFCKIFVPIESYSQYKSAYGWSHYADNLIGNDFENNEIVERNPNFRAKPFDNEIWYTNGSTDEPTVPNRPDALNSNILSNSYDAEKGCWIITFEYKLTQIGPYAFSHCFNLNSIILPNTVEVIQERAFEKCSNLRSVVLGKGVSVIKDFAFDECENITDITIPDNVTSIGCNPFKGCIKLCKFRGKYASEDKKYLIKDDKIIAFALGSGEKDCFIPNMVKSIGNFSFSKCHSLTYIHLPKTIISIGDSAFSLCENLINVNIPNSVTSIGKFAFGWCKKLTDVVIPDSVTKIGENAFQTCHGLRSMIIPDSVVEIGEAAFIWCTNLKSVYIPNSVKKIGQRAFKSCSKLICINIPEGITTIEHRTFYECNSLTSIIIPSSVKKIESEAFDCCYNLIEIHCKAKNPPKGDLFIFRLGKNFKIYVPLESKELYKLSDDWSCYQDNITEDSN